MLSIYIKDCISVVNNVGGYIFAIQCQRKQLVMLFGYNREISTSARNDFNHTVRSDSTASYGRNIEHVIGHSHTEVIDIQTVHIRSRLAPYHYSCNLTCEIGKPNRSESTYFLVADSHRLKQCRIGIGCHINRECFGIREIAYSIFEFQLSIAYY